MSKSKEAILIAEPSAYYGKYPGTGFNYRRFFTASPREKLSIILQAEEYIMANKAYWYIGGNFKFPLTNF